MKALELHKNATKKGHSIFKENNSMLRITKNYLSRGSGLLSHFGFARFLLVFFYKLANLAKHC